jgi:hypothetical protein
MVLIDNSLYNVVPEINGGADRGFQQRSNSFEIGFSFGGARGGIPS